MRPNLGDVLADKYRLERVLGEGGMSMVFAATNVLTGKQVAIKWLQAEVVRDDEQTKRLLREAQATSAIDHPNVVNSFDVGRHGEAMFLVMELLHGEPLSELLARGPREPTEFVRLMMPVLRGVHAAHRMGIVHRDLKPDNIFMCRDPHGEPREPKVLDFGISKLADNALAADAQLTREGTVFGTPQYMAPEQMRDARIADPRSDVYALGVLFYRALADQYPYDADTLTALAIRIVEGDAQPLHELCPHVEVGLSDVVMRALALDPEHRYQTVAALGHALEPYADGVLFAPSADRDSSPTLPRQSSPGLHDSAPSLRHSQPLGHDRPALASRSLRHSKPLLNSQALRISQPPVVNDPLPLQPAVANSQALAHGQAVAHGQPRRDAQASPVARPSLRIPPPPPPSSQALALSRAPSAAPAEGDGREGLSESRPMAVPPRPSSGMDVPITSAEVTLRMGAQQVARASSRRRTLLVGAALFTLGSVAPVGWQALTSANGASQRTANVVSHPQSSTGSALTRAGQAPRESASAAAAAATDAPEETAAAAAPSALPPAATTRSSVRPVEEALPRGMEAPEVLGPDETEETSRSSARAARAAARQASRSAARAGASGPAANATQSPSASVVDDEEPSASSEERAAPLTQTERNPYLR